MARALVVRRGETVDAYHLLSTVGQVASSSASHCSEPYDGDIERYWHCVRNRVICRIVALR